MEEKFNKKNNNKQQLWPLDQPEGGPKCVFVGHSVGNMTLMLL